MLVRIQGKVAAVNIVNGVGKSTGRPWSKKVYTISDDFRNPDYNRSVNVEDFGRLDPNSYDAKFDYKSDFLVGDKVDIACFLETNDYGFTSVSYYKPFEDVERRPIETQSQGNVTYAEDEPVEQEPVPMQEEDKDVLPF